MRIRMPLGSHLNSYHPKERPEKARAAVDSDIHPIGNDYIHKVSTYKARAHEGPIIKSPQDRALWRRAVYLPHSPHSPPLQTPSSPDTSWASTKSCTSLPQSITPPHPVCFLCMGYLGDEYSYTTCNSCKTKYATPSHRVSDEDEYVDAFFSPSPSPQDEDSDAPIILLDGCIAKGKQPCSIIDANSCATLASPTPSLTCSDDEYDGYVTPLSCSSSVYSQDEIESPFTGRTNSCVTPALSTSSSVYSQDEYGAEGIQTDRVETKGVGTNTIGYYDLSCLARYFGDYQQLKSKGSEEIVEEDYSLAIDIHYK